MGSSEFSLTWEDHHTTLVGVFEKLLENSIFVDCTIAAEGQYIKAHKIILSACSPYFELLFCQEIEKNPIIVFKDIKFQEIKAILDFVYSGTVEIPEDRLKAVVEAAESLQIKGLGEGLGEKIFGKGQNQFPSVQRRESYTSSSARKKSRRSSVPQADKNSVLISPRNDMSNESNNYKSVQIEASNDVTSPHVKRACDGINSHGTAGHVYCEETSKVGVQSSTVQCIAMQGALLSTERSVENGPTVVNSKPEPLTEVFVPESEFSVDINEGCSEQMTAVDGNDSLILVKREHIDEFSAPSEDVTSPLVQLACHSINSHGTAGHVYCEDTSNVGKRSSTVQCSDMQAALLSTGRSIEVGPTVVDSKQETLTEIFVPQSEFSVDINEVCSEEMTPVDGVNGNDSLLLVKRELIDSFSDAGDHLQYQDASAGDSHRFENSSSPSAAPPGGLRESELFRNGFSGAGRASETTARTAERRRRGNGPEGDASSAGPSRPLVRRRKPGRPLRCPECGKTFVRRSYYLKHKLTHSLERSPEPLDDQPFECKLCDKAFKRHWELLRHRRVHTGERPHKCKFCERRFSEPCNLTQHMLLHSGQKPFRCDLCPKSFATKPYLRLHLRRHAEVRSSETQAKLKTFHKGEYL